MSKEIMKLVVSPELRCILNDVTASENLVSAMKSGRTTMIRVGNETFLIEPVTPSMKVMHPEEKRETMFVKVMWRVLAFAWILFLIVPYIAAAILVERIANALITLK